jgi:S1-C subfamily serine protease
MDKLGATFETLPKTEAVDMGIKGGVRVKDIKEKGAFTKTRMEENYVITKVNGKEVLNLEDFRKEIDKSTGEIKLEGMYPGFEGVFPYKINPDAR